MSESRRSLDGGFTLLELMIVVSIIAIIASVGVPQYVSALRTARIGKAKHELVTIASAIGEFQASNQGQLPLTLYQVGFGGRLDPWGVPYCYLNYADGSGDGLQWAIDAGLVDPSALQGASSGGSAPAPAPVPPSGRPPARGSFLPWAAPPLLAPQNPPKDFESWELAMRLSRMMPRPTTSLEVEALATGIASSTDFSMYLGVQTETTRRRDRYMFPLNTDYDLFSLGPNARTSVSLGEGMALDDVIRANNGGFFGVAADY